MKIQNMQGFYANNKRSIYCIYMIIKNKFIHQLGRKFKIGLIEQISITIFKLKYNLPDRLMEDIFKIDHVTIHRIIKRISVQLSQFNLKNNNNNNNNIKNNNDQYNSEFYIVDSTTLRIGKGKNSKTYSGYKHHHGVKFQVIINDKKIIQSVSSSYPGSIHDKKLFLSEYKNLTEKIDKNLSILGDKAYAGLNPYHLEIPIKRNELKYKKDKILSKTNNQSISSKRIKVEHVFAYMKHFRILQRLNHYKIDKIEIFFNAIARIYNLTH